MGKGSLDGAPTAGIISVILGKRPDGMEVIGKDDDCIDIKRPLPADAAESVSENTDMACE
jgi:hypothetical protein